MSGLHLDDATDTPLTTGRAHSAGWRIAGNRPGIPDSASALSRLTARDRRLLRSLAGHKVLTTEQIAAIAFPSLDRAQHRLIQLYRLHAVDRFRLPTDYDRLTSWNYTLGVLGSRIIAAERGTTPPPPADVRARVIRLAGHPALPHLLGINQFYVDLTHHTRTHPDHHLASWWQEHDARGVTGDLITPDAIGTWTARDRCIVFALEVDTGTEPLRQLVSKLDGYVDLGDAGGPRLSQPDLAHVDQVPFVVLFWVTSTRRETALRELLARYPAIGAAYCWSVATSSTSLGSPALGIWQPLGQDRRRRLSELGTNPAPAREAWNAHSNARI